MRKVCLRLLTLMLIVERKMMTKKKVGKRHVQRLLWKLSDPS
jgi:hypothetical protein